jgi:hypothetical protein
MGNGRRWKSGCLFYMMEEAKTEADSNEKRVFSYQRDLISNLKMQKKMCFKEKKDKT